MILKAKKYLAMMMISVSLLNTSICYAAPKLINSSNTTSPSKKITFTLSKNYVENAPEISLQELYELYKKDWDEAVDKYANQPINITGKVIEAYPGYLFLAIEGNNSNNFGNDNIISFNVNDNSFQYDFSKIKVDSIVKFQCEIIPVLQYNDEVNLKLNTNTPLIFIEYEEPEYEFDETIKSGEVIPLSKIQKDLTYDLNKAVNLYKEKEIIISGIISSSYYDSYSSYISLKPNTDDFEKDSLLYKSSFTADISINKVFKKAEMNRIKNLKNGDELKIKGKVSYVDASYIKLEFENHKIMSDYCSP